MRWNYSKTIFWIALGTGLTGAVVGGLIRGKPEAGLGAALVMLVFGLPITAVADRLAWRRERRAARDPTAS